MQRTYTQHGEAFFAFVEPVSQNQKDGTQPIAAHNFYIFDASGFCWLQMQHVEIKFVLNQLGNGFFKTRTIYTIDTPAEAFRHPIVATDEWIQGVADRGFALETIQNSLGLNLQYLTKIMEIEKE